MCYFLCIAVVEEKFDGALIDTSGVQMTEITHEVLGMATLGGRLKGTSFLITEGGCSCALLGVAHSKGKEEVKRVTQVILDFARVSRSVSVLVHVAGGPLAAEVLPPIEKLRISMQDFLAMFPKIREDVRYVLA